MQKRKIKKATKLEQTQSQTPVINEYKTQILTILICSIIGYYYVQHLSTLFENDKNISYLSTLERELSFRTESGLYYFYFKYLVESSNNSITSLLHDQQTEYPTQINALQRFNLYPEVVLAYVYKLADYFNLLKHECFQVNRGQNVPTIQSCVGLKEPILFYAQSVFFLHSTVIVILFLLSTLLANTSLIAGCIGVLCFIYNHGEATRVMWTPALRESFSFPFHFIQLYLVTRVCKDANSTNRTSLWCLVFITLLNLLTWQFAQFSLGTQALALYGTYILGYMEKQKLIFFIKSHTISLILCFLFMFANRMLLASFFSSILCSIWLLIAIDSTPVFSKIRLNKIVSIVIHGVLVILFAFIIKKYCLPMVFQIDDDSHIWDILKSKIMTILKSNSNFQTFDTLLYTCAPEFDFLQFNTLEKLFQTLLLPVCVLNLAACIFILIKKRCTVLNENELNADGYVVYTLIQLCAYTVMALIIMRLKLFWTPYLCAITGLLLNDKFSVFNISELCKRLKYPIVFVLVACMTFSGGLKNVKIQYSIIGEYNDYAMENLMNWINANTRATDTFACSMPLCANLKLSTQRSIILHPHYEDVDLRKRVQFYYTHLYGYKSPEAFYKTLKNDYKVDYLVLESYYCTGHPPKRPECALSHLAHIDQSKKVSHEQVCKMLIDQGESVRKYFKKIFEYTHLTVYKL